MFDSIYDSMTTMQDDIFSCLQVQKPKATTMCLSFSGSMFFICQFVTRQKQQAINKSVPVSAFSFSFSFPFSFPFFENCASETYLRQSAMPSESAAACSQKR
jgi:hypothetical protein